MNAIIQPSKMPTVPKPTRKQVIRALAQQISKENAEYNKKHEAEYDAVQKKMDEMVQAAQIKWLRKATISELKEFLGSYTPCEGEIRVDLNYKAKAPIDQKAYDELLKKRNSLQRVESVSVIEMQIERMQERMMIDNIMALPEIKSMATAFIAQS